VRRWIGSSGDLRLRSETRSEFSLLATLLGPDRYHPANAAQDKNGLALKRGHDPVYVMYAVIGAVIGGAGERIRANVVGGVVSASAVLYGFASGGWISAARHRYGADRG